MVTAPDVIRNIPTSTPAIISTTPLLANKISILEKIVGDYHSTHTYSMYDLFVCADMAIDVWNIVRTQGIDAKIQVGNVEDPNAKQDNYNHAWVLAEVEPFKYVALETTGGYLVWERENENYYRGFTFDNPREFKEYLDKIKHPCSEGYILGSDTLCHQACGGNTYCTGNSVCINGQCLGCGSGYILGDDLKCHQSCGSTYCTGNSVCTNGQCLGCNPGYILGEDSRCHLACGANTYCTGNSVCINGQCRGCNPGYILGADLRCYQECPIGSGRYCQSGVCGTDGLCHFG